MAAEPPTSRPAAPGPRKGRRRPHPAKQARHNVAVASVASFLVLTGGMAVSASLSAAASSAARTSTTATTTSGTSSSTSGSSQNWSTTPGSQQSTNVITQSSGS